MPFANDVVNSNMERISGEKSQSSQKFVSNYRFDVSVCINHLKDNIIGQEIAINAIENILYRVKANMRVANKPLAVSLLYGPTGVGKTHIVHSLAQTVLGDANALCRIDMNTLGQAHYSAALAGSPPGYAGSKENHTLFDIDAITGSYSKPGIVLFDEIEKASQEVLHSLLAVLDHGVMVLSSGEKTIDFSNSLIFMTSNLGAKTLLKRNFFSSFIKKLETLNYFKDLSRLQNSNQALKEISTYFMPEFFNRIEQFIEFHPLDQSQLDKLVELEVAKLNRRLRKHDLSVDFSFATKKFLLRHYQSEYGARNLHHIVRSQIDSIIAKRLIQGITAKCLEVDYSGGKFSLSENIQ